MAESKPSKKRRKQPAKTSAGKASEGFSAEERALIRERARELKRSGKTDGESDALGKIAEMHESDRAIIKSVAPEHPHATQSGPETGARRGVES